MNEKYEKINRIAACNRVYKARDRNTNTIAALKKVNIEEEEGVPAATIREIALIKEVSKHRNIVELIDVINENGKLYLVFEFLNRDLKRFMNSINGLLPPELVKVKNPQKSQSILELSFLQTNQRVTCTNFYLELLSVIYIELCIGISNLITCNILFQFPFQKVRS